MEPLGRRPTLARLLLALIGLLVALPPASVAPVAAQQTRQITPPDIAFKLIDRIQTPSWSSFFVAGDSAYIGDAHLFRTAAISAAGPGAVSGKLLLDREFWSAVHVVSPQIGAQQQYSFPYRLFLPASRR